jgi:hypothetical protein
LEEEFDKVGRNLKFIKGQVAHTKNANLGLYKQIRLEHELKEVIGKKDELQMEMA